MNTEREREDTTFKLLVSPIHCSFFLKFNMARKLREWKMRLLYSQETKSRERGARYSRDQVSRKTKRRRENRRRAFPLFHRPARPRFGYVNRFLAVRWTSTAKAIRSTVPRRWGGRTNSRENGGEIRPYFLSLRLGRETDFLRGKTVSTDLISFKDLHNCFLKNRMGLFLFLKNR